MALLRHNARLIADLFAEEAGRFVAVSAGDNLEATMAANSTTSTSALIPSSGAVPVVIKSLVFPAALGHGPR